ncbi:hypothetical protein ES288_D01G161300v1 [Gossypium darwinii]|uniref:Uncharacterized protein n=1 Tax=Gossypium darwinii TaxID=34276 RepID=A0A5D2DR27_GOSDA|nr:hypothetical protein ES288_D01G161300v1 [Gossypium darwinii]
MRGHLPSALWSVFRDPSSEMGKRGENEKPLPLSKLASDDGEGLTTTTASGADSDAWTTGGRRALGGGGVRGGGTARIAGAWACGAGA